MDACEEYAAGLEPSACSIAGAAPRALAPPRIHANHSEYVRGQTVYPLEYGATVWALPTQEA